MSVTAAVTTVSSAVIMARVVIRRRAGRIGLRVLILPTSRLAETLVLDRTALDNLVEFTTIKPHAAAFRALVNFDALALAHDEVDLADGTRQSIGLVNPNR